MDFGLAFSFPFKDSDWFKKIALIGLVSLIPIVGQLFLLGWSLEITRRVIHHDPVSLPDIDLGKNLADGFLATIIGLIYSIPLIIISIPFGILSGLSNDPNLNMVLTLASLCFGLVCLVYGLFLAFVLPAAYASFVATGQFGAAFQFGEIFSLIRAAPGAYVLVILGVLISGIIAPLGLILCIIGVLLTAAYALSVAGHLYGQAYNQARATRGLAA